ncbi:MAG TPA: hypothetical protein VNP02_18485 [Gammaproteobacteria bacterium]|nr:hypothetical protein [Gammaproteobacteria bacterium]
MAACVQRPRAKVQHPCRYSSELHIADAQRMEEGAVAVVKLPLRLRSGDGEVVAAVAAADLQFVPA